MQYQDRKGTQLGSESWYTPVRATGRVEDEQVGKDRTAQSTRKRRSEA